jgi:hypothetical protein
MDSRAAKISASRQAYWDNKFKDIPEGFRICTTCDQLLEYHLFSKQKDGKHGLASECKKCRRLYKDKWWGNFSPEAKLHGYARKRAKGKNREFDIEVEDVVIPEICPVLKIPMIKPSIDRIDSSKGYIKGNIRVISYRANQLKSNGTLEEMKLVVEDFERIEAEKNKN